MNGKKTILFVCYGLGIGGIEKCFVNLLNVIPQKYEVDVLLMNPYYVFKKQIKRNVHFLNTFDYVMNIEDTMSEIKQRGGILRNFRMFLAYCVFRLRIKLHKDAWKGFKRLPKKYDIAVAYSHHDFSPYYVIDKVEAGKKCMWFHNGAYEKRAAGYERDKKYYALFDKIVVVSNDCANMLCTKFKFRDKQLVVLRNICDSIDILEKSKEPLSAPFECGVFHIVTVARMTSEKGAMLAIATCKQIWEKGYNIRWHWVGDGNQLDIVRTEIKRYRLDYIFILEGNQDNPYPFIKAADIYVQPSIYEAYSTTVTEAKVLQKPIVVTDVGGMREQLQDGINGLIVPCTAMDISNAIISLIEDINKRNSFCEELGKEKFSNDSSIKKHEELIFS